MRLYGFTMMALVAALASAAAAPSGAQSNPFIGDWNITGDPPNEAYIYWLEVKDDGGTPTALFLNRGGSPVPVEGRQDRQRRADLHPAR